MRHLVSVEDGVAAHLNAISDGTDGCKVKNERDKEQCQVLVNLLLVSEHLLPIDGQQDANAEGRLHEQQENGLKVVLGLILQEQVVFLLVLRDH